MALFYRFGPFRLNTEVEALCRGTEPIALGRRAVALLRALVERPGVLVSKDELIAAAWPGLAVEDSNLTVQIAALRRVLEEAPGEHRIVTLPRRGYRFVGPVVKEECGDTAVAATGVAPILALPDKPSIAVLPFTNMSSDPEQEYFTDGIVEEIITALSRFSSLFVIARNTSFTYKGRSVDVKQVGHELGVRYVLEGSVRKAGTQVRITSQLIDASTGAHLWANRFDGSFADIFDLQDQVALGVVGAVTSKLEQAEIKRAKRKPTDSLDAYDYYLRGCESLYQQTRESTSEALALFDKAIQLDPGFSLAYAMASFCYTQRKAFGWIIDRAGEIAEAALLARRAVELGKDDAVALSRAGLTLTYVVEDFNAGALFIDRALVLNPNLSTAWYASGQLRIWTGEPEIAIKHLERFIRMSPLDPIMARAHSAIAFAHVFAGRFEEAVRYADRALSEQPKWHQSLRAAATSNALAGRIEQARAAMARLREIDPGLRVSDLKNVTPLQRPQDAGKYAEGMRLAGLPE
jgi:TolB-like protein/Tfp pilus assembly protein PilF